MPYVSVFIHCVWSTKYRFAYLNNRSLRYQLWTHIRENAREKGFYIDFISGWEDHCHCLICLGSNQTIQEVILNLKGESSHWINSQKLTEQTFAWQSGYWAMGVSESHLPRVRRYIENQENHHNKVAFDTELKKIESTFTFLNQQNDID
jgi:REP element-mobilizing transposase RayT